jgi:hypothetical protein
MINYEALEAAKVDLDPYPHFVVPNFLGPDNLKKVIRDFPDLDMAGLFLPEATHYGPVFEKLLAELAGPRLRAMVSEKLDVDLTGRPALVELRSCCQAGDGQIHADSKFKLATLLLYLNEPWAPKGGRLRVLRSSTDMNDYAAEVPPEGGTLFAFKVQPNSWHGHEPFVGPRRYVMLNYCRDEDVMTREAARHRLSGRVKKFKRLFGVGKVPAAHVRVPQDGTGLR